MSQLSIGTFPNDLLRYVFCQAEPKDVKQLIIWSLVNQQFNFCSGDISLWRQFAEKHSIAKCTTGAQVKQALIDIARREFNPEQSWSLFSSHQVYTKFTDSSCSLSNMDSPDRPVKPCGSRLPITFNNKTCSIEIRKKVGVFLHIKDENSNTVVDTIRFKGYADKSPLSDIRFTPDVMTYPYPQDCDVQLNDDVLVCYDASNHDCITLAMGYLDNNHNSAEFIMGYPNLTNGFAIEKACRYLIYQGLDPITWELSKGGLTYTTFKRAENINHANDMHYIFDVDETKYVNFALMPLVKALNLLKMIDQDQICLLREFVSSTAKVPPNFFCPVLGEIMSNPVRDRCGGKNGGCLCDKETFLRSFAEGQALLTPPKLGREFPAKCPFSTKLMPSIARTCSSIRKEIEDETVIVDGEENVTVSTPKFIPCFSLNTNGGLTHDIQLQGEILAWLQNQVFKVEFKKWPEARKNAYYEELYHVLKPANPYWAIAEHAFHGLNEQCATMEQKVAALQNLQNVEKETDVSDAIKKKIRSAHFFEERMESFMAAFSQLPNSFKQEVYGYLQGGEDAFHGRNGQSSTREEKMEALRRCIHAAEIDALEWMF